MSIGKDALEALLKYHDDKYYNQDDPEISDAQYDALKNSYVELYGEYNYVPGEASTNLKTYNHTTNVSSLDKVQITDVEKLKSHIHRLWPVIIQPKMDGLTVVTYPISNGSLGYSKLEHVTRGNGSVGEIITDKMQKVLGVGTSGVAQHLPIRSEVVMLKSEFNKINEERIANGEKPFKNTRNAAAGMLRQLDPSKVKGLKAFAYNIIFEEENNLSACQIDILKNEWNWNTVDTYIPETEEDALNYILSYEEEYRADLDYDIDGLVIKHNGEKVFGYTGHHPKGAVAIKFKAKGEWTTLIRIVWQVGRTGKITPVAEFEPIDLDGSTVTRATLHNYGIIETLGLTRIAYRGKYDPITRVLVVKANDVIPAIIAVKHPTEGDYTKFIDEPKECPVCSGKVEKINDQLFCINPNCESKVTGRLVHLAQKDAFDIEGLSEETAKKLIAKYRNNMQMLIGECLQKLDGTGDYVKLSEEYEDKLNNMHPSFIYDLSLDDIKDLPGFAEKSATKLYNEIRKSLTIPFNKFLYGCGIPLIGRSISKDIAEFYYEKEGISEFINFLADYENDFKLLREMHGIGSEMINSLKENLDTMLDPFGNYDFEITDVIPKKKATNQLTFVITGEFDIPRKDIKAMIEEAGHKVSGSVSSKTSYLLAAPGEENTAKYKKAVSLETPILNSIDDLKDII